MKAYRIATVLQHCKLDQGFPVYILFKVDTTHILSPFKQYLLNLKAHTLYADKNNKKTPNTNIKKFAATELESKMKTIGFFF